MECTTRLMDSVAQEIAGQVESAIGRGEEINISEIEQAVQQTMQEIGQRCVRAALEQLEGQYAAPESRCRCGEKAQYRCRRAGKIISLFGRVSYRRAYYLCPACRQGHYVLDRRLGIRPGQVTPALGAHLARLGVLTSFGEAKKLVAALLLVEVSHTTVHKETLGFGRLQEQREAEWQAESQDPERLLARERQAGVGDSNAPRRLYGSLDGVIVPVDQEWRELKIGCWYYAAAKRSHATAVGEQSLRAEQISYYCDFAQAQEFGDLLWATGCQREADLAEEVVFVADGATWIWKLVDHHFPDAVQIVDWYHAVAYLSPVANAAYGTGDPIAKAWFKRVKGLLWDGQVRRVIKECRRLQRKYPYAREPARKAITFFTNHTKRMDYARLRQEGYLIGSGTVESGCKQIGTFRLKRTGARWSYEGARLTAKARSAYLSQDWPILTQNRANLALAA